MSFTKEYRNIHDELPEWGYLTEIGVRNMLGKPIRKGIEELVVDRENNYYLIPQGHTNPNRDVREIHFYALCLDGVVLNMEVVENSTGCAFDYDFECHWDIEKIKYKIKYPENWNFDKISEEELISIIVDAFTVETYNETFTPERTKSLTVKVSALSEEVFCVR